MEIVNIFGAKVVSATPKSLTIEVTGDEEKIEAVLELIKPFGIKELVRTGKIAIART
jgi:acetolactate synthase-1/3 small subunit